MRTKTGYLNYSITNPVLLFSLREVTLGNEEKWISELTNRKVWQVASQAFQSVGKQLKAKQRQGKALNPTELQFQKIKKVKKPQIMYHRSTNKESVVHNFQIEVNRGKLPLIRYIITTSAPIKQENTPPEEIEDFVNLMPAGAAADQGEEASWEAEYEVLDLTDESDSQEPAASKPQEASQVGSCVIS